MLNVKFVDSKENNANENKAKKVITTTISSNNTK